MQCLHFYFVSRVESLVSMVGGQDIDVQVKTASDTSTFTKHFYINITMRIVR